MRIVFSPRLSHFASLLVLVVSACGASALSSGSGPSVCSVDVDGAVSVEALPADVDLALPMLDLGW